MITENLPNLKINKLSQKQYDRESVAGNLNENEIYLTPDTSLTVWQPNTEYKVGDVCLAGCMVDDWPVHAICACIEEHTSDYDNAPTNFEQKVWNKVYVSAGQSYEDVLGNVIHTTYATKEEVGNKISLWQPNTEYKVGDVCLAGCMVDDWPVHAICACIEEHTSDYDNAPTNFEQKVWNKVYVSAGQSYEDVLGNVIHTTYATKEEVGNKISLWQPNTEYKVGDVVIENFGNGYMGNPRTGVLRCVKNHTSSDYFDQDYLGDSKWEQKKDVWAEYGYRDYLGNLIPDHYATKEELAEAIGQALEGDY